MKVSEYLEKYKDELGLELKEILYFKSVEALEHGDQFEHDLRSCCSVDPVVLCKLLEKKQLIQSLGEFENKALYSLKQDDKDSFFFVSTEMKKVSLKTPSLNFEETFEQTTITSSHKKEFVITKTIDVDDVAAKALAFAKQGDVMNVFKLIALPFKEGDGLKEAVILKMLEKAGFTASYEKGIGIRVLPKKERRILLVSHIDLIKTFNNGFNNDKICEIDKNIIKGALDNTITNAVALTCFIALKDKQEDIELLLTEGEEIDLLGMRAYLKKYSSRDGFFVNLDVTNDNWDAGFSVEYDHPSYKICTQLKEKFGKVAGITKERFCDDFDEIEKVGGKGFSFCLPTMGTIHSYKNYTTSEKVSFYLKGLLFILDKMDVSSCEPDIKNLTIKKALKFSYEEFVIAEENAKPKKPEYNYSKDWDHKCGNAEIWDDVRYDRVYDNEEFNNGFLENIKDVSKNMLGYKLPEDAVKFFKKKMRNNKFFSIEEFLKESKMLNIDSDFLIQSLFDENLLTRVDITDEDVSSSQLFYKLVYMDDNFEREEKFLRVTEPLEGEEIYPPIALLEFFECCFEKDFGFSKTNMKEKGTSDDDIKKIIECLSSSEVIEKRDKKYFFKKQSTESLFEECYEEKLSLELVNSAFCNDAPYIEDVIISAMRHTDGFFCKEDLEEVSADEAADIIYFLIFNNLIIQCDTNLYQVNM